MPKKKPPTDGPTKLRPDVAETAYRVMREAIGEGAKTIPPSEREKNEKNPEAVQRGAKGGKKGGKVRSDNLTPEQRAEAARVASSARWKRGD